MVCGVAIKSGISLWIKHKFDAQTLISDKRKVQPKFGLIYNNIAQSKQQTRQIMTKSSILSIVLNHY